MSQPTAEALTPLPFELVYDDGEPLETEWHTLEYPFCGSSFAKPWQPSLPIAVVPAQSESRSAGLRAATHRVH